MVWVPNGGVSLFANCCIHLQYRCVNMPCEYCHYYVYFVLNVQFCLDDISSFYFLQIVMCKYHTVFLTTTGSVYTCGHGFGGRLGHLTEETCLVCLITVLK